MASPNSPGDMDKRRKLLKLLDRLDTVHPKCMPDAIVDRWLHGNADARRKIEEAVDGMPKKSN